MTCLGPCRLLVPAMLLLLTACAGLESQGTEPRLASESECFASANSSRCKLAHDLAGGYPFALDRSR